MKKCINCKRPKRPKGATTVGSGWCNCLGDRHTHLRNSCLHDFQEMKNIFICRKCSYIKEHNKNFGGKE